MKPKTLPPTPASGENILLGLRAVSCAGVPCQQHWHDVMRHVHQIEANDRARRESHREELLRLPEPWPLRGLLRLLGLSQALSSSGSCIEHALHWIAAALVAVLDQAVTSTTTEDVAIRPW